METSRTKMFFCVLFSWLAVAGVAQGDWLVTQEGKQVETKGPWEIRRNLVVFTHPNGTLSSMRLSEVDLEKSKELTAQALKPPPEPEVEAAKESVLRLTNRDVGEGEEGSTGPDALVEKLKNAHKYQDLGLMMGMVNWQDTPDGIRTVMESQFEWMLERRLRDVVLNEVTPDDALQQVLNDVTYEPNVDVTHKLEVQFVPDPDAEEQILTLYIGTRLGSYQIAAARPLEDDF